MNLCEHVCVCVCSPESHHHKAGEMHLDTYKSESKLLPRRRTKRHAYICRKKARNPTMHKTHNTHSLVIQWQQVVEAIYASEHKTSCAVSNCIPYIHISQSMWIVLVRRCASVRHHIGVARLALVKVKPMRRNISYRTLYSEQHQTHTPTNQHTHLSTRRCEPEI